MIRALFSLAANELRIERRTREVVGTTVTFAVLVVVSMSIVFHKDEWNAAGDAIDASCMDDCRSIGLAVAPGILWLATAFAGVLAVNRSWARERENEAFSAILAAPIGRSAIFLAKTLVASGYLVAVQIISIAALALAYNLDVTRISPVALVVLVLGIVGYAATATLFGALTLRTRARDVTLGLVVLPLTAPVLLAAAVATRTLIDGAPVAEIVAWLRILGAYDLVALGVGALLFDHIVAD